MYQETNPQYVSSLPINSTDPRLQPRVVPVERSASPTTSSYPSYGVSRVQAQPAGVLPRSSPQLGATASYQAPRSSPQLSTTAGYQGSSPRASYLPASSVTRAGVTVTTTGAASAYPTLPRSPAYVSGSGLDADKAGSSGVRLIRAGSPSTGGTGGAAVYSGYGSAELAGYYEGSKDHVDYHGSDADVRYGRRPIPLTRGLFVGFGVLSLLVLCFLPVWDAIALMNNFTYRYWHSIDVPLMVVLFSFGIVLLFWIIVEVLFHGLSTRNRVSTQTLVMVTALFLSILGVMFVVMSMPISRRSTRTYNDVIFNCDSAKDTRELRSRYIDLLLLRESEDCLGMETVEDCDGYEKDKSYDNYLKKLEERTRCSGFCVYEDPAPSQSLLSVDQAVKASLGSHVPEEASGPKLADSRAANKTAAGSVVTLRSKTRAKQGANIGAGPNHTGSSSVPVALPVVVGSSAAMRKGRADMWFPPTLFSTANYEVTCSGTVAREFKNLGSAVGEHLWRLGLALVGLSLMLSLFEVAVFAGESK